MRCEICNNFRGKLDKDGVCDDCNDYINSTFKTKTDGSNREKNKRQ